MWSHFYTSAISYIENGDPPSYFIDSKIRDLSKHLGQIDKNVILHETLQSSKASEIFRYFNKNKALEYICWNLDVLRFVPQDKGKSNNAFDHTLKVIDVVPKERTLLRWVALLHDFGKYDSHVIDKNFRRHQLFSHRTAEIFTRLYEVPEAAKVVNIVKNHMFPLDYQRNPNWTMRAVRRLIERIGEDDVIETVQFSYYDKKSENDYVEYLKPILELERMVRSELKN